MNQRAEKSTTTELHRQDKRSERTVQLRSDRTLRRIGFIIWILAASCLVLATVLWVILLRGLP